MDELGTILREAREAKGLTLAEAHQATRIGSKFLEALETGQYELLPTQVHVRGYLRNYARFLGLDPQPLLERYEVGREQRPRTASLEPQRDEALANVPSLDAPEEQVFFDPVNVDLHGNRQSDGGSVVRIVIIIALLASLALVANRFIPLLTGNGDGSEALTAGIEEAVNNIRANGTPTADAAAVVDADSALTASQPITSTSRNDALQLPTPTNTRPALPATLEEIRLRLEISERTWMRVTIDDEVVFEGMARRGDDPYEWVAQESATLLTGNAIGIVVTVNDVELGRLGGRGEVIEETWTATERG
ncbi:MAG: helix-turn-helix domain-containing protein [Candidatus Promineifilaceae bacterium]|nr:helix-turn-helix domain-containing protein [Candidatus Promineifilaceae bacterium]